MTSPLPSVPSFSIKDKVLEWAEQAPTEEDRVKREKMAGVAMVVAGVAVVAIMVATSALFPVLTTSSTSLIKAMLLPFSVLSTIYLVGEGIGIYKNASRKKEGADDEQKQSSPSKLAPWMLAACGVSFLALSYFVYGGAMLSSGWTYVGLLMVARGFWAMDDNKEGAKYIEAAPVQSHAQNEKRRELSIELEEENRAESMSIESLEAESEAASAKEVANPVPMPPGFLERMWYNFVNMFSGGVETRYGDDRDHPQSETSRRKEDQRGQEQVAAARSQQLRGPEAEKVRTNQYRQERIARRRALGATRRTTVSEDGTLSIHGAASH